MRKLYKSSTGGVFLLAAIAVAVAAGLAAWFFIRAAAPSVPVLVAKAELTPGTLIAGDRLAVVDMPRAALPKDRVTADTYELVVGSHARTWVAAGDPIRLEHLSELRTGAGAVAALTALENPSLRAYALPPDATDGLSIQVGDRLDLIGVMDAVVPVEGREGQTTRSRVIVQNAPVLWVLTGDYDAPYLDVTVSVGLAPEEAERVALFEVKGNLKAQIRPAGVDEIVGTAGADAWTVFGAGYWE